MNVKMLIFRVISPVQVGACGLVVYEVKLSYWLPCLMRLLTSSGLESLIIEAMVLHRALSLSLSLFLLRKSLN